MSTITIEAPAEKLAPSAPSAPATPLRFTDKPKPIVYLGLSAYDWKVECGTADSTFNTLANSHCIIIKDWGAGDAAIGRKRNFQAHRMLTQTKAQFLFFVDGDILFEPWHFDRIVSHNLPVCGGVYFKKSPKLEPVIAGQLSAEDPDSHLMKVNCAGTGFLCIRRDVFEAMIARYGEAIEYKGDPDQEKRWDFFPFGAVKNSYRSEDWYFCDRARECGFDVQVDMSVQVGHIGKIIFPLVRFVDDSTFIDLAFHKYGTLPEQMKEFLAAQPIPPKLPK